MDLADEVDEPFAGFRDALLGPVGEMELTDRPGLAILNLNKNPVAMNKCITPRELGRLHACYTKGSLRNGTEGISFMPTLSRNLNELEGSLYQ